jgi:amino acid permease
MYKNTILPVSLLAGTIIGAGVFALPFVFQKAGIVTGLFYLGLFGAVFVFIHLMYADLILKTEEGKNLHRFSGYAKIYLGNKCFWLSILMTIVGMLFTLTIYLILSISFINLIHPLNLDISNTAKLLIFWFLGSVAIFLGIRRIAFSEFLITGGVFVIILIILGYGLSYWERIVLIPVFNLQNIFLPYGAVLFALSGRVAIPAVISYFQKINQPLTKIKKSIILGTLLPALVYLLFVFGIWGLSNVVSEDAVSGLIGQIPQGVLTLVGILGLISLWSSYIVIGLDVENSLKFDLKFPKILASFTVLIFPLFLYFLGFQNFLNLVSMVGGIFISLEGIFIVSMWLKSLKIKSEGFIFKKLNPIVIYGLIIIFFGGIIYQFIY